MNIGIDIDDTINRLSDILPKYAKKYNKENNIKYKIKENEWNFDKAFGWNDEHCEGFLNKYIEECFSKVRIKKMAKKYINKLKKEGNNIIIITSRSKNHCKDVYNISKNWILKHDIIIDDLLVDWTDKSIPCIEKNIDIFIDDNIEICENIKEKANIPVLMFNSVYNQNEHGLNRVYNWKEVYTQVKKYEQLSQKENTTINI